MTVPKAESSVGCGGPCAPDDHAQRGVRNCGAHGKQETAKPSSTRRESCRDPHAGRRSGAPPGERTKCVTACPRFAQPTPKGCRVKCASRAPSQRRDTLERCIQKCLADPPEPIPSGD